MIGNTIEFLYFDFSNFSDYERKKSNEERKTIGLVVDAYTEITGSITGKSETFLGFGSGDTTGDTKSKRKYVVQYTPSWSNTPKFYTMEAWQLSKIISFPSQSNQELNEEKIKLVESN